MSYGLCVPSSVRANRPTFAAVAEIVAAHSKIENRILRIVSLPDFVEHSPTHREEIGDNANAGRRIRTTKTWAVALLSLRALDRRVV